MHASDINSNAAAERFAADRLAFFGKGDVAALLNQYSPDARVVTPTGVLHGREQIKGMIEGIIGEFGEPGTKFDLLSQTVEGPIVSFMWRADTARNVYGLGAETYVLGGDGLARYQTFAAKVEPKAGRN